MDDAFKDYDFRFGLNDRLNETATTELYTACKIWLREKRTKADVKAKPFKAAYQNMTLINRRRTIAKVAVECLKALSEAGCITPAEERFGTRKIEMRAQGLDAPPVLALSGTYMHERETWVKSRKQAALSATVVRDELRSQQKLRKFDALSLDDYKQWAGRVAGGANQVEYHRKAVQLDHMVNFVRGQLYNAKTANRIDHKLPDHAAWPRPLDIKINYFFTQWNIFQGSLAMYAMDQYGNLFESLQKKGKQLQIPYGSYNHSTFVAGRAVICAGLIGINNGTLVWIDNSSGHYKPPVNNLREAVEILNKERADLTHAMVGRWDMPNNRVDVFSAANFLQNPNGQPDIGTI